MNKTNTQPRLSNGRFASKNATKQPRLSNGRFASSNSASTVNVKSTSKSSFIKSMFEKDGLVHVTMNRNPKTMYSYKPTASGMSAVKNAIRTGSHLGEAYNQYLRGREVSRTIFVK